MFIPNTTRLVEERNFEFEWSMGMARPQKQKSIASFHEIARKDGYTKVLEISTYSPEPLGVKLSAFNLQLVLGTSSGTVEELYQKSKVLRETDDVQALETKSQKGLPPISFEFEGFKWPLEPLSGFYDWLYINALQQNPDLSKKILEFQAFTDIAYNPKKSLSTQARAAALYVSLIQIRKIQQTKGPKEFLKLLGSYDYMRGIKTLFS